ncbi:MAG TPA: right-handed parallel beta-helix repeat-containing protein [Ktedonobacteraceae bacterium]|nr:right-handed parallel beta-helix repeat-containing protein [Ktedonobacteraceae bacterium]
MLLPFGSPPAPAQKMYYTYIVAPTGGDFTTLSAALGTAVSGNTIYVKPGSYSEAGGTFSQTNLTIVGAGTEAVTMTLGANLILSGNYLKLSGCTIDAGASYQIEITGQYSTLTLNHLKGSAAMYFLSDYYYNSYFHNKFEATGSSARCLFGPRNRIVGNHFIAPHNTNGGVWLDANTTFSANFLYYQAISAGGGPILYTGGEWCSITGNSFFCGNGAALTSDFRCTFTGNSVYQVGGDAVQVVDGCTVSGNAIWLDYAGNGIFINDSSTGYGATVVGNSVIGNGTPLSSSVGIYVNSGNNAIINGNSIANIATGIDVISGATKTILTSNNISGFTTAITDSGTSTVNANNITV